MAARNMISPAQEQRVRNAIRTTCLMQRLEKFAMQEDDPQTKKPVQMNADQVRAALGLLAKTLPDLRAVEHSAGDGFIGSFVVVGQREVKDSGAWSVEHSPTDGK